MEIYFKYRRESIVLKILNDLYVSHFLEFQIIAIKKLVQIDFKVLLKGSETSQIKT